MRIIAGQFRGTSLADVGSGDRAAHLRPTSDRVRESIFNMITMGRMARSLDGARVLDLFAGTGALGLEALSRGASRVTFVENGRAAFKLLSRNIAKLRAAELCTVLTKDATCLTPNPYDPFDVVFLDPPYGKGLGEAALISARAANWLAPEALVVWEESAPCPPPPGFHPLDHRAFGGTHVTFLENA